MSPLFVTFGLLLLLGVVICADARGGPGGEDWDWKAPYALWRPHSPGE